MRVEGRYIFNAVAVGIIAVTPMAEPLLNARRPSLASRVSQNFVVRNGDDSGRGSLRDALLRTPLAAGPVRILVRPSRIVLRSALPPLVSRAGLTIDATASRCELDARAVAGVPALEIRSPNTLIAGLGIVTAGAQGVRVLAERAQFRGVRIRNCSEAVYIGDERADATIQDSLFDTNSVGVQMATQRSRLLIRKSRFANHRKAAIWAVFPTAPTTGEGVSVRVIANVFQGDQIGLVAMNVRVHVEHNEFIGARDAGAHLFGSGAVLTDNQIRGGHSHGVIVEEGNGVVLDRNEIHDNEGAGVMLRAGRNVIVSENRIHTNGYGVAATYGDPQQPHRLVQNIVVGNQFDGFYIVGGSPLIERNRSMNNRQAGIRILDLIDGGGKKIASAPVLVANLVQANAVDTPLHGQFSLR